MDPIALKPISGYDEGIYSPVIRQKEYQMTWCEWASKNLQKITYFGTSTSYSILYTVPIGYNLYISSIYYSAVNGSVVGSGNSGFRIGVETISNVRLPIAIAGQTLPHEGKNHEYTSFIKVPSDVDIGIFCPGFGGDYISGGFVGYLEKLGE